MVYDRLTEAEREKFSARATDEHYDRLHHANHDSRIPYRKCEECKKVGWR